MADRKIAENVEPLKKWDKLVKRNSNGQFERGSKALAGAGRPPGSLNKTTSAAKRSDPGRIGSCWRQRGQRWLFAPIGDRNSSAFASLLGKVLPTTLAASDLTVD